jgi:hypothetical protein
VDFDEKDNSTPFQPVEMYLAAVGIMAGGGLL